METIKAATTRYEAWLTKNSKTDSADLKYKHGKLKKTEFGFLRGTFYRWVQTFPNACPSLAKAPEVPCSGDCHIENFGTWRDREARLCWGVNDFDEAYSYPYTLGLVRLATS